MRPAALAGAAPVLRGGAEAALGRARAEGVGGKAVTPFLLAEVARLLGPEVVEANVALLEENARVAGEVAAEMARRS